MEFNSGCTTGELLSTVKSLCRSSFLFGRCFVSILVGCFISNIFLGCCISVILVRRFSSSVLVGNCIVGIFLGLCLSGFLGSSLLGGLLCNSRYLSRSGFFGGIRLSGVATSIQQKQRRAECEDDHNLFHNMYLLNSILLRIAGVFLFFDFVLFPC